MDTMEFRKLLSTLDEPLERLKKEAEARLKREAVEQHIKLVVHQISSLESRKAEFVKYGVKAPVDIEGVIGRLRGEKEALERQLETGDPVEDRQMRDADRKEALALTDEVLSTNVSDFSEQERWLRFEIWATRWRMIVERAGVQATENGVIKRAYATIAEKVKGWRVTEQGWFIDALDKSKAGQGINWGVKLEACQAALGEIEQGRRQERASEEAQEKAITDLEEAIANYAKSGVDIAYRELCHAIRMAAKWEHLREDVAAMVEVWKSELGEEFAFLWQKDEPESMLEKDEEKRIGSREIMRRILHRLRSKACIGASHAPIEKMWKGFPDHDQARAKEGLELLVKMGVIRRKNSGIGPRVSIEAGMVKKVDAFFQGKELGIKMLDDWCAEEFRRV